MDIQQMETSVIFYSENKYTMFHKNPELLKQPIVRISIPQE